MVSALAYVVIFSIPWAQDLFILDPANVATTSMALAVGLVGAAAVEALWWLQGRLPGSGDGCGIGGRHGR